MPEYNADSSEKLHARYEQHLILVCDNGSLALKRRWKGPCHRLALNSFCSSVACSKGGHLWWLWLQKQCTVNIKLYFMFQLYSYLLTNKNLVLFSMVSHFCPLHWAQKTCDLQSLHYELRKLRASGYSCNTWNSTISWLLPPQNK